MQLNYGLIGAISTKKWSYGSQYTVSSIINAYQKKSELYFKVNIKPSDLYSSSVGHLMIKKSPEMQCQNAELPVKPGVHLLHAG